MSTQAQKEAINAVAKGLGDLLTVAGHFSTHARVLEALMRKAGAINALKFAGQRTVTVSGKLEHCEPVEESMKPFVDQQIQELENKNRFLAGDAPAEDQQSGNTPKNG